MIPKETKQLTISTTRYVLKLINESENIGRKYVKWKSEKKRDENEKVIKLHMRENIKVDLSPWT